MTQIQASESGTLVRHGLRRHRCVHPHTRVYRTAGVLLVPPVRAYVTRTATRAVRACVSYSCILGE